MDSIPENQHDHPVYDQEIEQIEEEQPPQQQPPPKLHEETRLRTAAEETSASSSRAPTEITEEQERREAPPSPPSEVHIPAHDNLRLRLTGRIGSSCGGVVKVYGATQVGQDSRTQAEVTRQDLPHALMYAPNRGACQLFEQRMDREVGLPVHANILHIEHFNRNLDGSGFAVLPLMELGSVRDIMLAKFPEGMPEEFVVVVLKEILQGLKRIHQYGRVHTEISLGYIFLTKGVQIKLAFASGVYDHGVDPYQASSILEWAAAPEIHNGGGNVEYTQQADLWMIGVVALEMAYGGFRVPGRASLETFLDHIRREKKLPEKRSEGGSSSRMPGGGSSPRRMPKCFNVPFIDQLMGPRVFSTKFEKLVMNCLQEKPEKRPKSIAKLLKTKVFTECKKDVRDFYRLVISTPDAVRREDEAGRD